MSSHDEAVVNIVDRYEADIARLCVEKGLQPPQKVSLENLGPGAQKAALAQLVYDKCALVTGHYRPPTPPNDHQNIRDAFKLAARQELKDC